LGVEELKKKFKKAKECEDCGEFIPPERSRAAPNAVLCIKCQRQLESEGKFQKHKLQVVPKMKSDELDTIVEVFHKGTKV